MRRDRLRCVVPLRCPPASPAGRSDASVLKHLRLRPGERLFSTTVEWSARRFGLAKRSEPRTGRRAGRGGRNLVRWYWLLPMVALASAR